MAANKRYRKSFRWTLFQDFDSAASYEAGEQKVSDICESANAPCNGSNELNFTTVNLFPEYDLTGAKTGGYRAVICVIGKMSEQAQREILNKFMRFGWHF